MPLVSLSGASVAFGERKLLDSVNLTVASRSRMALVGPNGSGKTTLMRILAGQAVPDSGTVVREKETRVSYVPQSVAASVVDPESPPTPLWEEAEKAFDRGAQLVRESAALEERLGALSPESSDAEALLWKHHELQEKIEATGYHARAESMHRVLTGLSFSTADFSKGCTEFSAGWQMRIALARAILRDPPILILDEATSQVDLESEQAIQKVLEKFVVGRTVIIITHRLAILALADRIVVMQDGRIVDTGSHEELLTKSALYRRLYQIHFDDMRQTA